jgi:hypothetical protein
MTELQLHIDTYYIAFDDVKSISQQVRQVRYANTPYNAS